MHKIKLMGALLAMLMIAGCADLKELSGETAPIDERAVATAGPGTAGKGPAASAGAGTVATAGTAAGAATGPASGKGAATGSGQDGVGTAGIGTGQGIETRALPAAGAAGGPVGTGATGAAGETGTSVGATSTTIVGVTPAEGAKLQDPANVLSKRVIYFDFDSDAIREEFRPLIEAHAGFLGSNGAARIILQGHTDERGSRDYNLALGQRRAESVKQALTLMGVKSDQVETVSLGEEKPVDEGHDESAWKQNRRAEIHYLGE